MVYDRSATQAAKDTDAAKKSSQAKIYEMEKEYA